MGKTIEIKHEDPILRTFMLFIQSAREITKYSDSRFFRDLKLSTVKYIALKALTVSGGTLTPGDLAAWTDTKRHNITTLLRRMKAEGLVTTERNEEDKRFTRVSLTNEGRDLFVKATAVAHSLVNELMSGIDKRQATQLERLLNILKRNIFGTSASGASPHKSFSRK